MAEDDTLDEEEKAGLSSDDIIPNTYEGGFKTWECALDLANFLAANPRYLNDSFGRDLTVVEVGHYSPSLSREPSGLPMRYV